MASRGQLPQGGLSKDIRSLIQTVVNAFQSRANAICASTCDGIILRMHYKWTFSVFLGLYFGVMYSWFHGTQITCVSHHNAESQVRLDYLNVCLSYIFVTENENKRFLLYYRWLPWAMSLLAGIYYIPRKVSKSFDNSRCKKLLEDMAANTYRYDHTERALVDKSAAYMIFNLRTHDGLYWKYLAVNVISFIVDIFAFFYLDFILQGRFISYGIDAYPFERDPRYFTDHMSRVFPPFAFCEIDERKQLMSARTEKFGCHLTMMELYEKVFLAIWLWLFVLSTMTACYIVFLLTMRLPIVQTYLLRPSKPAHGVDRVRDITAKVIQNCKIGDIYLLYRMRSHLSHVRFYELIMKLSDPGIYKKQPKPTPDEETKVQKENALNQPIFTPGKTAPTAYPLNQPPFIPGVPMQSPYPSNQSPYTPGNNMILNMTQGANPAYQHHQ